MGVDGVASKYGTNRIAHLDLRLPGVGMRKEFNTSLGYHRRFLGSKLGDIHKTILRSIIRTGAGEGEGDGDGERTSGLDKTMRIAMITVTPIIKGASKGQ